jgi:hypothetical protein
MAPSITQFAGEAAKWTSLKPASCQRAWYGPWSRKTFDDEAVGVLEGKPEAQDSQQNKHTGDTDGNDTRISLKSLTRMKQMWSVVRTQAPVLRMMKATGMLCS